MVCLINLEMLGRGDYIFMTGGEFGNIQSLFNKELARIDRKKYGKRFFKNDPFREHLLFTRSDNYPFALLRIPAYTIMGTSDVEQYYHTVDDEAESLDYERIAWIANALVLAINPVINNGVIPWRINPANANLIDNAY
jgi:Zn-dependent M28 family amino/carboxypeptidase